MKIVEVASLKEAFLIKTEMNYVGDYMVLTWENGRELVVQLEDSPIRYRWKEEVVRREVIAEEAEESIMPKETTPITAMKGSSVFSDKRSVAI